MVPSRVLREPLAPSMSRVELYAAIRRDARAGVSGREIQRRYKVGWRTVKQALSSAWPKERKAYPQRASKLDPFKPAIDAMLRADLRAPRKKQRHTVKRIFDRLINEHGMTDVSYPRETAMPKPPLTCDNRYHVLYRHLIHGHHL